MKQTIKLKLYPKRRKIQALKQSLGNARFVWNKLLAMNIERYQSEKKFIFYYDMCKEITKLKKQYPFLNLSSIYTLQQTARKLDISLRQFLKHNQEFPRFKSKNRHEGTLIFPDGFKISDKAIYLPKIGWITIRDKATKKPIWNTIQSTAKQIWVKEEPDGFFAHILYEDEPKPLPSTNTAVGIDVGIKQTITTSDNEILSLPTQEIMKTVKKIEHLQSIIDTKREINKQRNIPHSKRIQHLKNKRRKLYKRLHNLKKDFYYKSVNHILKSHEYVIVEDLNLKELKELTSDNEKRDRKIHKYLQYISLSEFFRILEWKAKQYNRTLIRIDPHHTSKTCSNCGYIDHNLTLSDRTYNCPVCGLHIDRDYNASLNILKRGLEHIAPSLGHSEYMREMASGVIP